MNDAGAALSEREFARRVDALAGEPATAQRTRLLLGLLHEDDEVYRERGSAATARMRGWVLLALSRPTLPDEAVLHAVEELDNGRSPYLVAAAARSLTRLPRALPALAPFLVQALVRVRDADEYLDLDRYGGECIADEGKTAFTELLATLRWLGPHAVGVRHALAELLHTRDRPLSADEAGDVTRTLAVIAAANARLEAPELHDQTDGTSQALDEKIVDPCCSGIDAWGACRRWLADGRDARHAASGTPKTDGIRFEDQDGVPVTFDAFFHGQPSIVVFFYTRCDNAQKCSLTVSKLARVQQRLRDEGLAGRIRTAAITYDPAFDLPGRLKGYAASRGVATDADHRVLRASSGQASLRSLFDLKVNFVSSLVNRHRIEAFVLDAQGCVSVSFERIRFDETRLVEEARALLCKAAVSPPLETAGAEPDSRQPSPNGAVGGRPRARAGKSPEAMSPLLALAMAVFPKCPLCGATYLSASGLAAMPSLPPGYWVFPALVLAAVVNLVLLGRLAHARRRWEGLALAIVATVVLLVFGIADDQPGAVWTGVLLSLAGSIAAVALPDRRAAGETDPRPREATMPSVEAAP